VLISDIALRERIPRKFIADIQLPSCSAHDGRVHVADSENYCALLSQAAESRVSVVTALNCLATPEVKLVNAPKNFCVPSAELVHVVVNVPLVLSVKVLVNVMGPITTPSSLTVSTPVLLDGFHSAARLNGPSPVPKPVDGHFPPLIFEQRMDPLQFSPKTV
jgi:hypothetical protein